MGSAKLVGWERAGRVEKHFKSIQRMVNSSLEDWTSIDGIGIKTATKIMAELRGEK